MDEMDNEGGVLDAALEGLAPRPQGDNRRSGHLGLADVHALWGSGTVARAMDAALLMLETDQENPELWDLVIRLMRALGQDEQALSSVTTAIWLCPHDAGLSVLRGDLLRTMGRQPEAQRAYRMALILDPDHQGARRSLAISLFDTGQQEEAVSVLKEVDSEEVARARLLLHEAHNLTRQEQHDAAFAALGKALAIAPAWAAPYTEIARRFRDMGKPREAIKWYRYAATLGPTRGGRHVQYGLAALEIGQEESAENAFRRAIALAPEYLEAYAQLGKLLKAQMRSVESKKVLGRAGRLDPTQTEVGGALTASPPWVLARSAWQTR